MRPRDQLARAAELKVDPRGGVIIDAGCTTSDPRILAIGEVASFDGQLRRARRPRLRDGRGRRDPPARRRRDLPRLRRLSTKLKLNGVDVASFGDAFATTPGALDVVYADPVAGVYKKLVLSDDAQTLLGGILVGDASAYGMLRPLVGGAARRRPRRLPHARGRRAMRSRTPSCPTRRSCARATA